MTVSLRPVRKDDQEFLFRLYASTRSEELTRIGWTPAQKESFLRMQFNAQTQHYQNVYPEMNSQIILHDGQRTGCFLVACLEKEIRLVDIALLPEHCNTGIGTMLIKKLVDEGQRKNKPVRLHVETFNRARRLYERLGFRELNSTGVYLFMEWLPATASNAVSAHLADANR